MAKENHEIQKALPRGQRWLIDSIGAGDHKELFSKAREGICFGVANAAIMARLTMQKQSVNQDFFKEFLHRLIFIANGGFNGLLQKTQQTKRKMTDAIAYAKLNTFHETRLKFEENNLHFKAKFNIDPKQLPKATIDAFNNALHKQIVKLASSCKSSKPLPHQIIAQAKKSVLESMQTHFEPEICHVFLESGVFIDVDYERQEGLKQSEPLDIAEGKKAAVTFLKEFQDIAQEKIEKFRKTLTPEEEQILQAPAFGDMIVLLQNPSQFTYLLDKKSESKDEEKSRNKHTQTDLPALPMIQSVALEAAGGVEKITTFTGIYSLSKLRTYFTSLEATLKDTTEPVALSLSSHNHNIAVIYEPSIKKWCFIDANQLAFADDSHCCDSATIAKWVFAASSLPQANRFTTFATQIYAGNTKQLPAIREAINTWQQSSVFQTLHEITPEKATQYNAQGITWLYIAAQQGRLDTVRMLLAKGAKPNQGNHNGATPLFVAAQNGYSEVVRILLANGAKPNQSRTDGITPLFIAAQQGHPDVVQILLANGANPNQSRADGVTPLLIAAQQGHLGVMQILLANGANPNQSHADGVTPLLIAVQQRHLDIIRILLKANADPDLLLGWYKTRQDQNKEILQSLEGYSATRAKFENWVNDLNEDSIKKIDSIPVVPAAFKEEVLCQKITLALQEKSFHSVKLALACLKYFAQNSSITFSTDHLFRDVLHQLLANKCTDILTLMTVINLNPRCVNLKNAEGHTALDCAAKAGCSQEVFKVLLATHAVPADHRSETKSAADGKKKLTYGRFLNGQQPAISQSGRPSNIPSHSSSNLSATT